MSPPDNIERHRPGPDLHDEIRMAALAMERMAGGMATPRARFDRSKSLLTAIANRTPVLAARDRPRPVTKDDPQPVLTGLLQFLQRHDRPADDGRRDRS